MLRCAPSMSTTPHLSLSQAWRALAAVAMICAVSSPAAAQSVLDRVQGLYFPEGRGTWDCRSLGMDGGAVGVQGRMLHGVESTCELHSDKPVPGLDATVFQTTCRGEGMEWDGGPVLMMPAYDGLGLTLLRENGFATTWRRCN